MEISAPARNWGKMWARCVSSGRWGGGVQFVYMGGSNKRSSRHFNIKWCCSNLSVEVWGVYRNIVTHTVWVGDRINGCIGRG